MCLIIYKPASIRITKELADDVFTKNKDGFGLIYHDAEAKTVNSFKILGTKEQIWEALQPFMDKELLMHWRMQTHGDIDLENCHPYELIPDGPLPSYMMHNGILSTGNAADKTKSDTWHYIRDYLRPIVQANPEVLHTPAFQALVKNHIGNSNKFAIMDGRGEVVIINREAGIEFEGMWFSNTYAWSASYFGAYKSVNNGYQGYQGGKQQWNGGRNVNVNKSFTPNQHLFDDEDYMGIGNPAYQAWWDRQFSNKPKQESRIITLPDNSKSNKAKIPGVDYSATAKDPSLAGVTFHNEQEPLDLEDLYFDARRVLDAVDKDKITRPMVLTTMRHIGFDNALALTDMTWEGKLSAAGLISAFRSTDAAKNFVNRMLDGGVNAKSKSA